jgi:biotin transporter BioY
VYIVAIAWLYVAAMMAITERSLVGGLLTFIFYGLLPLALLLWLVGTPQRRRNRLAKRTDEGGIDDD